MEYEALELIELMYSQIAEAKRMPLAADKCIIERDNMLAMLEDLRDNLPREMEESRRMWEAKDEFIARAKAEAEQVRLTAEQQARQLIDEQAIVQQATAKAEGIVANAMQKQSEILSMVYGQIDAAVAESEATMAGALDQVRALRSKLRGAGASAAPKQSGYEAMGEFEEL